MAGTRSFDDWLYEPSFEESICSNPFHDTVKKVFDGYSSLDPYAPDPANPYTKLANLIKAELILLEGDVIYVRERNALHPLNEATELLAYYMHTDSREARKAADVLESNFQGYFPVCQGKVWRGGIVIIVEGERRNVHLPTLEYVENPEGYPEFGVSEASYRSSMPLIEYFCAMNEAVHDEWFFEKTLMYPFTQPFREKSHVLVGGGGNGKSLFMKMVQRLYGDKAITDAPQPTFKGHDPAVISYNFIGKKVVTFNDVGDPSTAFLEWMKRMITGNLEVKTPSGAWLSIPCNANFLMETNHRPQVLDIEAHRRRFVVREFDPDFKLREHIDEQMLDAIGERGDVTAADIVVYLLQVKPAIEDWTYFEDRAPELPEPTGMEDF